MKPKTRKPESQFVTRSISLPVEMPALIEKRCAELDTDFSKYVRRLLRGDLAAAGLVSPLKAA